MCATTSSAPSATSGSRRWSAGSTTGSGSPRPATSSRSPPTCCSTSTSSSLARSRSLLVGRLHLQAVAEDGAEDLRRLVHRLLPLVEPERGRPARRRDGELLRTERGLGDRRRRDLVEGQVHRAVDGGGRGRRAR